MAYGTLSTLDTLAAVRQSVVAFGEDRAWESISQALDAHNNQVNEMMGSLIERTTDTRRSYGTGDTKTMDEMDQWGQGDAQKISAAVTTDFPLRRFGNSRCSGPASGWPRTRPRSSPRRSPPSSTRTATRSSAGQAGHLHSTTNSSYIDYLGFPAGVTLTIRRIRQQRRRRLPGGTER
jgi:hypothetical protein